MSLRVDWNRGTYILDRMLFSAYPHILSHFAYMPFHFIPWFLCIWHRMVANSCAAHEKTDFRAAHEWHANSYMHLLKIVFGVESASEIIYVCILQQVQFL